MHRRKSLSLVILGLSAALSPAFGAEVHVPIATPLTGGNGGGVAYRTEVVVSNPGAEASTFLPEFKAASETKGRTLSPRTLAAGGTTVLRQLAAPGKPGLLTLSGFGELTVTARLEALSSDGRILSSTPAPVVTPANAFAAGEAAYLQGLRRNHGEAVQLGLVNLAAESAQCWATAYRADGSAATEVKVTVAPRSARLWSEPLAALARGAFAEARVEVSCDAPFYAYAVNTKPAGEASFQLPAQVLAESLDDEETGDDLDVATGAAVQATCAAGDSEILPLNGGLDGMQIDGEFLHVRAADLCRAFELPIPNNVAYRHIKVEVDMYMDRWTTPLFHNIMSLRRSGRTRNERVLYGGMIIRGDNKKTVLDLGRESLKKEVGPWAPGTTYRLVMDADVPSKKVVLSVFEGENLVQQISGKLTAREIMSVAGKRVKVDFSSPGVGDGAYFPPTNWTFSNLKVTATQR
ncbi:MAG TPA: hypothetical protein VHU81_20000 [Thermoanaerobaculia bacterium]|nr:hypothetical protein [Thermoanaerobaculia bacterium]